MQLDLTKKQFRRLLDLVYIGNWVLNSARGPDRLGDYDEVESLLFGKCAEEKMDVLCDTRGPVALPSKAFAEGGIHEAIMDYEDAVFFSILSEELAHRDASEEGFLGDSKELYTRMNAYMEEFIQNGILNVTVDTDL